MKAPCWVVVRVAFGELVVVAVDVKPWLLKLFVLVGRYLLGIMTGGLVFRLSLLEAHFICLVPLLPLFR